MHYHNIFKELKVDHPLDEATLPAKHRSQPVMATSPRQSAAQYTLGLFSTFYTGCYTIYSALSYNAYGKREPYTASQLLAEQTASGHKAVGFSYINVDTAAAYLFV